VPFEKAFGLSPTDYASFQLTDAERTALWVVTGEMESGQQFNWKTWTWNERK